MILFKSLLHFFCNLAKTILAGACIGLFVEVGVIQGLDNRKYLSNLKSALS